MAQVWSRISAVMGNTGVWDKRTGFNIRIRHADWLGSSRLTSTWERGTYADSALAPFGENYAAPIGDPGDYTFTGQNHILATGNYDFQFRKLNAVQGRWISPDPAGLAAVDLTNPQSLNRYAYVLNNPVSLTDPLGLDCSGGSFSSGGLLPGSVSISVSAQCPLPVGFGNVLFTAILSGMRRLIPPISEFEPRPNADRLGALSGAPHPPAPTPEPDPANNTTNCSHGFGIGVQGGGTAAAGLKSGGVVTGQLGGGLFVNSSGPSVGGYASGALAGRWGSSTGGYPSQSLQAPWVGGAYAGYGPGIFITNAGSPAQLGGPFAVLNIDIGIGIGKASIALAADKSGTVILTINGGPFPYAGGLGFDVSGFTSNTKTVGTGCKP